MRPVVRNEGLLWVEVVIGVQSNEPSKMVGMDLYQYLAGRCSVDSCQSARRFTGRYWLECRSLISHETGGAEVIGVRNHRMC